MIAPSWNERLRPLMRRPGEWLLLGEYATPKMAMNRQSHLQRNPKRRPPGVWKFATRGSALYGCYEHSPGGSMSKTLTLQEMAEEIVTAGDEEKVIQFWRAVEAEAIERCARIAAGHPWEQFALASAIRSAGSAK